MEAVMRNCVLYLLLCLLPLNSGCGCINWLAHVTAPSAPTKNVKAQFGDLKAKTVAVAVYAGPETLLDYQTVQLEISDAVVAELRKRVSKVTVVNPLQVIRYQDENPGWTALPPEKLCRDLGADFVLLVSLMEFSTRAPGSIHLARGRIIAEASLYKSSQPGENPSGRPVWRSQLIRVVYPEQSPLGVPVSDDRDIRLRTARIFAERLAKNFYDHKVPKEQ